MRGNKKATDQQIIDSYKRFGNVWAVGRELGMCGQSIHERLCRLGAVKKMRVFTEEEVNVLMQEYLKNSEDRTLDLLAKRMGRSKPFICRKAKELGLTNFSSPLGDRKRTTDKGGYTYVYGPKQTKAMHEHRIKAELVLGRPLNKNEIVHHLDGDRVNNANNNLAIMDRGYHQWIHSQMRKQR